MGQCDAYCSLTCFVASLLMMKLDPLLAMEEEKGCLNDSTCRTLVREVEDQVERVSSSRMTMRPILICYKSQQTRVTRRSKVVDAREHAIKVVKYHCRLVL